ncbi:MAG: hypothetical protein GY859_19110, partial [Desulfobacterales bacterium]|nr:hypothetical protein [Desulfobacterales bacterium]
RIQPRVTARQDIVVTFTDAIIDYDSRVRFNVRDAGVFEFKFFTPEGFRVVDVGAGDAVDDFSLTREKGREVLRVLLKKKARGEFILPIRLEADKEDKNISIALPKLTCIGVEKEEGVIALSLKKNLKLTTEGVKGLRPIRPDQLGASRARKENDENAALAALAAGWAYSTTDYACTLIIEKRKTKIIAMVERNLHLEETVLKINDVIRYNILYAPVSAFRLELPAPLGKEAVVTGDNIKEKRFIADEAGGKGQWMVTLHAPRMNQYTLTIHQEIKLPEAEIGKKRRIAAPSLRVLDLFNESGAVSVSKDPGLQVEAVFDNLEPIDSKELPAGMAGSRSVLAFKYLAHPYSLALESTRHEYEKVLDAIVNEAHFDIVVSREGVARTEGVILVQNTNRQSLEILMPEGFESVYAVFISGAKAGIGRGGSERSKIIMLPKEIQPGREFTLRIIYQSKIGEELDAMGRIHVESAEIVDVPISKVTWRLYLPEPWSYLHMEGSMEAVHGAYPSLGAMNAPLPSRRVPAQRRISMNDKNIVRQGDEKSLHGFDVQIIREGRLFSLAKLDGGAFSDVLYIKKSVLFNISLALVVLVAATFMLILLKTKLNKLNFIAFSILPVFLVWLLLPSGFKHFASLTILGIGISGLAMLGLHFHAAARRRKRESEL